MLKRFFGRFRKKPRTNTAALTETEKVPTPQKQKERRARKKGPIEYNKWYGLRKLRLIARGQKNFGVIKTIVLEKPSQLRLERVKGSERLLVRTDEKGRRYNILHWGGMSREDVPLSPKERQSKLDSKMAGFDGRARTDWKKARLIVHPTLSREKMAWTGQIRLFAQGNVPIIRIYLIKNPPIEKTTHRAFFDNYLEYNLNGKTFELTEKSRPAFEVSNKDLEFGKIMDRCLDFLRIGIGSNQIKPNRYLTEISFATFRKNPTYLEFYDLGELREQKRRNIKV